MQLEVYEAAFFTDGEAQVRKAPAAVEEMEQKIELPKLDALTYG